MGFFKFIYSTLLKREYPLITIEKYDDNSPYYANYPDRIILALTEKGRRVFRIETPQEELLLTLCSLEHEFLHYLLKEMFGMRATLGLDKVHAWSIELKRTFFGRKGFLKKGGGEKVFYTSFGYLTLKEIEEMVEK